MDNDDAIVAALVVGGVVALGLLCIGVPVDPYLTGAALCDIL